MTKNNQEEKNQKVLFYTGISRAFRTTSIANLYEISQVFPVVLLSAKLDSETEKILENKKLFPKIEKVVQAGEFTPLDGKPPRGFPGEKRNLFSQNIYVYKLAKNIIRKYKPTIVIMPSDVYILDFYIMRFAKKIGAINIVLNSDLRLSTAEEMSLRTDLTHVYFDLPSFLPFRFRFLLMKVRKYLGYILYNWILPLSVGQAPFFGKSSRILYSMSGERADYRIVYSKQDYELSVKEGIAEKKLVLLEHPLKRENTRRFFEKAYLLNLENRTKNKSKNKTKTFTLLYPEEPYGFKRDDYSLIKEKEMLKNRIEIINLIVNVLAGWKIFIKPHPATPKAEELKKIFEAISPFVTFTNPSEPIEKYIETSDVVAGFPPASGALFTATLQCPEKPILSLDLPPQEIFGDCYKNFDGIDYIDNGKKFINILELIRDGKYKKEAKTDLGEKGGFKDAVELLDFLIQAKD